MLCRGAALAAAGEACSFLVGGCLLSRASLGFLGAPGRAVNPGTALAHLRQTKGLGKSKSFRDTKIEIKLLFRIIYCSSDRQELFYRRHVWAVCVWLVAGVCLCGRQRFLVCSSFLWRWKMQVQVVAPASANPGLCKPHSCYRHL